MSGSLSDPFRMKPGELRDSIIASVQLLGAHGPPWHQAPLGPLGPLGPMAPGAPGTPLWVPPAGLCGGGGRSGEEDVGGLGRSVGFGGNGGIWGIWGIQWTPRLQKNIENGVPRPPEIRAPVWVS